MMIMNEKGKVELREIMSRLYSLTDCSEFYELNDSQRSALVSCYSILKVVHYNEFVGVAE